MVHPTARSIWSVPMATWLLASSVSARISVDNPKLSRSAGSDAIEGSYIVIMEDGADITLLPGFDRSYIKFRYDAILNGGYALQNVPDDLMESWMESDGVKWVFEDATVTQDSSMSSSNGRKVSQAMPPWGLDRIDSRTGLDEVYNSAFTGNGVTIVIIDSGVLATHEEFTGRIVGCFDFSGDGCDSPGSHGTHVAGIAAGTTYGVAKEARIMDVKVFKTTEDPFDVSDWSTVIAGFDLVAQLKKLDPDGKYVLNASLAGGFNQAMNRAAAEVAALDVLVIVAAGDDNFNACSVSPAAEVSVITVASSTIEDARSDFSNFGPCVDMFAPGSEIESASNTAVDASIVMSGTGMAAAHVAGIAAILLERGVPFPEEAIVGITTPDVVSDVKSSPNRLAYNGYVAAPTPPPTPFGCLPGQDIFKLDLLTDSFPREIYWNLKNDCTGKPVDRASPSRYTKSNTQYIEQFCIDSTRHTFTMLDTDGDGLIAPGKYDLSINRINVASGGSGNDNNYGGSQSITFGPDCPSAPTTTAPTVLPATQPPTQPPAQLPTAAPTVNCILAGSIGATISSIVQRGWGFFAG